jgi:hypothetical protein
MLKTAEKVGDDVMGHIEAAPGIIQGLGGPGVSFPNILSESLFSLINSSSKVWCELKTVVDCWTKILARMQMCELEQYVPLAVVRMLLDGLQRVRIGWDVAVWVTFDISLTVDELVQIVDYLINMACPTEIPSIGDIIECQLKGTITTEQFQCWSRMRGTDPRVWRPVRDARREQLTAQEYIQWARRHGMDQTVQAGLLRKLGWTNEDEAAARVELYDELPTIADILHFLTRNVFDTDYVARYGLLDGFEERFWPAYGPVCEQIGLPKVWASQHYAAHWITAAPTQMREFVHRLRPDKPGVANPFTVDDFRRVMREQDYLPFMIDRFADTIYNVPALSYVVEMFRNYTITADELRGVHLDLGFNTIDAERFLQVDILRRARIRASESRGWNPTALAHAFVSGQITEEQHTAEMAKMGYTAEEALVNRTRANADINYTSFTRARSRAVFALLGEIKSAVSVGVIDGPTAVRQLQIVGWPADYAASWVGITQVQARTAIVKQGVGTIRSQYYGGHINAEQAGLLLQQLGIVPEAITQYLQLWAVKLTRKRRTLARAEIIKELCSGHITTPDAIGRLENLGYDTPDIDIYLADAGQCIAQRRAKAEAASAKQAATEAKELLRLQREAARQAQSLRREAEKAEPVSKLQLWAKLGIEGAKSFATKLHRYGYSNAEIVKYWTEASRRKGSLADPNAISAVLPASDNPEPGTVLGGGP